MDTINDDKAFKDMVNNHAKTLKTDITLDETDKQRDNSHLVQYQWKPGQSGNLAGRPPQDLCITSKLRELLEQDSGNGKTNAQLVAEALISLAKDKAFQGNVPALKELLNRIEGKVADKIEGTENPVTIILRPARERDAIE